MGFPLLGKQAADGKVRPTGEQSLVAEVLEGEADSEVLGTEELDDGLEIVAFFAGDPDLAILERALDLEILRLDGFDDLLRLIAVDSLLHLELLNGVPQGRDGWVLLIDI